MKRPELLKSNHLYFLGLVLLVCGMPLSKFLMSISQFVLAGSFFLEGSFIEKFKRFFKNKAALAIVGIWMMHIIGLLYTNNLDEGFKDLRIKAPLLILTVIISGSLPLSQKQFWQVLGAFIASVFIGSVMCMAVLVGIIHYDLSDIRDIFLYSKISHIRFALFTCLAIFSIMYLIFYKGFWFSLFQKTVLSLLALWLLVFLLVIESVTGICIVLLTLLLMLVYFSFAKKNIYLRVSLFLTVVVIPMTIFFTLNKIANEYFTPREYPFSVQEKTKLGNAYTFDSTEKQFENGYPMYYYLSLSEMEVAWNNRSAIRFDSLDARNQYIKFTLIRFLTSKGLRKDAEAVASLSDKEVRAIERGVANVNYMDITSFKSRILQIVFEYDQFRKGGSSSGHSVMQRFEFWRAATDLIKQHALFGVGTGDMPQAYHEEYIKMNTTLSQKYWLRAHNQFLAITVAFGIVGLLYFLFALVYPMIRERKYLDFLYVTFWIIAIMSMVTEDTIETQAGATFFAFFNAFFLFAKREE